MPRDLLDENNFFYVRDTLHNIGPEYLEGELWDNSFVKAGTIIEMTEEAEEYHYQNMYTPRNYGLLNVVYRDDRPGLDDYINLLYRIPLSLDQLNSELNLQTQKRKRMEMLFQDVSDREMKIQQLLEDSDVRVQHLEEENLGLRMNNEEEKKNSEKMKEKIYQYYVPFSEKQSMGFLCTSYISILNLLVFIQQITSFCSYF